MERSSAVSDGRARAGTKRQPSRETAMGDGGYSVKGRWCLGCVSEVRHALWHARLRRPLRAQQERLCALPCRDSVVVWMAQFSIS